MAWFRKREPRPSQPAGIDSPDVLDAVALNDARGRVFLVVDVSRPWRRDDFEVLRSKVDTYVDFLASNGLTDHVPGWEDREVVVALDCLEAPPPALATGIAETAAGLASRHGLGLAVFVGRSVANTWPGTRGTDAAGALRGGMALARYVADRWSDLGAEDVQVHSADHLSCRLGDGRPEFLLGNLRLECRDLDAAALEAHVASWLASMHGQMGDDEPSVEQILPVVRLADFAAWAGEEAARAMPPLRHPLTANLSVYYVFDTEHAMSFVMPEDLETVGTDEDEIAERARENLRARCAELRSVAAGGLHVFVLDGFYESSLLLLDGVWDQFAENVRGDVVVSIPSRDLLMATGADEPHAMDGLRERLAQLPADLPHEIWRGLLVRREGRWEEVFQTGPDPV